MTRRGWWKWLGVLLPVVAGTMQLLQMVHDEKEMEAMVQEEVQRQLTDGQEETEDEEEAE